MSVLANIWSGLDWSYIGDILLRIIPALLCITLHELCHGLVAYWLGDDTAKRAGRLTLNPLRHIDVWGLVMMVVFKFGWAKPVPVDMRRFEKPKEGMALTALAGPVSNILLSVLALALYGCLFPRLYTAAVGGKLLDSVYYTAYLSCALAVFNIIPIPPLDGSKVLFSLLDNRRYAWLMYYERYGFLVLILLLATGIIDGPLNTATGWVFSKLFYVAEFTFRLGN